MFTTPKGTELLMINLKGKNYLPVAQRLVWFREERPDWGMETEIITANQELSIVKATLKNEMGRIIAQATKTETLKGFADHLEKAETGAIGRCLAIAGFGTQFAEGLEEGERIVDSPIPAKNEKTAGGLTLAQLNRLDAIASANKINNDQLGKLAKSIGIDSRQTMTIEQYNILISKIES